MYAPVNPSEGPVDPISAAPNWSRTHQHPSARSSRRSDYEREYNQFVDPSVLHQLEELPRATSAPPHLQDRLGAASTELFNRAANLEGMDSYTDVRYDEDYAAFYEMHPEKDQLPPPVDNHTLYNDMQSYLAQQQYKDVAGFPSGSRFGTFGGGYGSQANLSRGLETVEEQPLQRHKSSVDESLAAALNQMQLGNEIQRPGSQPAPNLLQATGVGHIRSASAFPRFDVDSLSGMPPPATSSPAPLNTLMPPMGSDYMGGSGSSNMFSSSLEFQAAYQAAYQAALLQQNTPQVASGLNMQGSAFSNGLHPHTMQPELQGVPQRDTSFHGLFNQPHQPHFNGTGRFEVYEEQPVHREERPGRGKRFPRRDREREVFPQESYYDSQYYKFNSIEEVVGQVIQVAQDQNGCRFLQRKFDEGGAQTIAFVFPEILENIVHLMKDPFGNYLIQKLLDRCSEDQRTQVVKAVAQKGELVTIALSTHGTRAVQKLIETLTTKEQRTLAIAALQSGVVHLIKDLNGNHVVQRCLQRLGPEDSQFIYDAAIGCCVEIASHRHGCCVLQRCIDFATSEQRMSMIMEISANAYVLSQDAFGNYVVQYVLDLGNQEASLRIMTVLSGHYADLAVQKFSSNVVEKCLKLGQLDDARENIIREIMQSPSLPRLLQDPYGNYVVQSALSVTSGTLHQSLVEAIRPYLPALRGTPHGKRILQKVPHLQPPQKFSPRYWHL